MCVSPPHSRAIPCEPQSCCYSYRSAQRRHRARASSLSRPLSPTVWFTPSRIPSLTHCRLHPYPLPHSHSCPLSSSPSLPLPTSPTVRFTPTLTPTLTHSRIEAPLPRMSQTQRTRTNAIGPDRQVFFLNAIQTAFKSQRSWERCSKPLSDSHTHPLSGSDGDGGDAAVLSPTPTLGLTLA